MVRFCSMWATTKSSTWTWAANTFTFNFVVFVLWKKFSGGMKCVFLGGGDVLFGGWRCAFLGGGNVSNLGGGDVLRWSDTQPLSEWERVGPMDRSDQGYLGPIKTQDLYTQIIQKCDKPNIWCVVSVDGVRPPWWAGRRSNLFASPQLAGQLEIIQPRSQAIKHIKGC